METIRITIDKKDVLAEVAKATDYTGSKLIDGDAGARDRILAADDDLAELDRFWAEAILAMNERMKSMLVSGTNSDSAYTASIEVSRAFDKTLTPSVQSALRSFFIACIIGKWFVFANKAEAADYLTQASALLDDAERLLYSRKRPTIPKD